MKRGSVPFALVLILLALLSACVQRAELNPENMTEEQTAELENYTGNIRLTSIDGIIYKAQTLKSAEGDSLYLANVEIINDGVMSKKRELVLAKNRIQNVELQKNNKWVVGGALAGISLMILVLYYEINGSF